MVEIRFKPGDVGSVVTGGIDSMDKFPSGTEDPGSPVNKELFFNTTENKFKRYETDHWVVIDHVEALSQIADGLITNSKIDDAAGIAKSKLAALEIADADVAAAAAIGQGKLDLAITDSEVAAGAGIAKDKLAPLDIRNTDINAAAEIAKSKLGALNIVDADVDAAAAIVKSKLEALAIVDADVSAIGQSKITDLVADLIAKVSTGPLSGDKKITAIGWNVATEEFIIDHEE